MAKNQQAITAAAKAATDTTDEMVKLKCEVLGVEGRDFTPAHAKALLAFQESKGLKDWQPVTDAPEAGSDK